MKKVMTDTTIDHHIARKDLPANLTKPRINKSCKDKSLKKEKGMKEKRERRSATLTSWRKRPKITIRGESLGRVLPSEMRRVTLLLLVDFVSQLTEPAHVSLS